MEGRLEGKIAIITGAATGIGEAIAHKFAKEGAKIVVAGLPDDPVADVVDAVNGAASNGEKVAVGFAGDLGEEAAAKACVQKAIDTFGRLDVLVNNAGAFPEVAPMEEFSVAAFETLVHCNIRTAFMMTRFALPHLQKSGGNIVSAGSEAGYNGVPNASPYGGTKGFIHAFTKGVAVEQAKHGVRANCVCPGAVDTAWTRAGKGPMDEEMTETMTGSTPLGRRGTPEEMANVYAFLASDEASYVSGALWLVDGGITIAHGMPGQKAPKQVSTEPALHYDARHQFDGRTSVLKH